MAKHSRARTWFQAGWFALTNGYVRGFTSGKIFTGNTKALCVPGLNCYSCPGALASCPIGSLQAVLNKSSYRASLYVFGLMSMFGVLFGRLVCSWMCPFGFVQDLLYKIKLGPKSKNLPGHGLLRRLRFVVLAVLVILLPMLVQDVTGTGEPWFCEWLCPSGTLLGGIPLTIMNKSFQAIIGFRFFWKMFILVSICLLSIWVYRPFCKYLCPLGAIYGLFNPVSTYRLEIDTSKCVKCHACQRACGMDIATFQTPNSMDCIRCGDCMKACPTGAISSTWGNMGQTIKSRCFVNDEDVLEAGAQAQAQTVRPSTMANSMPRTALKIMGIAMIVGGIASAMASAMFSLYVNFDNRLNIESLAEVGFATLLLGVMKVAASIVVALAGFYLLRNINDDDKVLTMSEKTRTAYLAYQVGLVATIINIIFEPGTISFLLSSLIYACYPILALFPLWMYFACLRKYVEIGKHKALMWVNFVIVVVLSVVTAAFFGVVLANLVFKLGL